MKRFLIVLLGSVAATGAYAADFGVGVSVKSDDAWLYFPVDISAHLRVEPSVRYTKTKSESRNEVIPGVTVTGRVEAHSLEAGLGLFGIHALSESANVYYGVRAAYIDSKIEQSVSDSFGNESTQKQSANGYRIAPTFGFEYRISKHFSIGGEAAWFYESLDGDADFSSQTATFETERNGTATYLIGRFFF